MTDRRELLNSGFLRSAERYPDNPALRLRGTEWSYAHLDHIARCWATELSNSDGGPPKRVGLFAHKSLASYAGMLAALYLGATVVPLNRKFPLERTRLMVEVSDVDAILADEASAPQLPAVLGSKKIRASIFSDSGRCESRPMTAPLPVDPDEVAYLLFTSGTTGLPKGVPISHRSITHFLDAMTERYDFGPGDRFTQNFDQTFDLSMFDLFMAWQSGGCLVPMDPIHQLAPFRFIAQNGISVWFSVPSVPGLLRENGSLTPNSLSTLRWSLFCGEALPAESARIWQQAAPFSVVENLYGPTEVTVACMAHRWSSRAANAGRSNGTVPIGVPIQGMHADLFSSQLELATDCEGEICLAGPQVFSGYWKNPALTAKALFEARGSDGAMRTWYRTGDVAKFNDDGEFIFLGRIDQQVKINGMRVEPGEIEGELNNQKGVTRSAVVAVAGSAVSTARLVAFVCGNELTEGAGSEIQRELRKHLPSYLVPHRIEVISEFPLNSNGKIDRSALKALSRAWT
ncbi:amino acid adenylation domain-containing protein [Streptomyces sp. NPDC057592]|uniref:amino acid adenylation domain-containing protein n=1 Tax=unclassified Streptomyces TaxID=2593676 RepID=UPI0036AB95C1